MTRRFDLIVFDLGGVLVRASRSWREGHQLVGFPFSAPSGSDFEARLAALPRRAIGAIDSDGYYELWAAASNGVYTAADARRISDASLFGEYLGIARVFDALDAVGIDTAVLSNTNDSHWARLFPPRLDTLEFPTLQRARHRFASHLLRVEKPDPRAYRAVEHATGHASDCILYFDDVPEYVAGAQTVGWAANFIDHTGDTAAQLLACLRHRGVITAD